MPDSCSRGQTYLEIISCNSGHLFLEIKRWSIGNLDLMVILDARVTGCQESSSGTVNLLILQLLRYL